KNSSRLTLRSICGESAAGIPQCRFKRSLCGWAGSGVKSFHVAFMSRGAAGSHWRPLKSLEKDLQHAQREKRHFRVIENQFCLSISRWCGDGNLNLEGRNAAD